MRVLAAALLVATLSACGAGPSQGPRKVTFTQPVSMEDFAFSPSSIQVEDRTRVKLSLTNSGGTLHNITVEGLGVDVDVDPGGQGSAVIEPKQPGVIAFYCKYHRASGMQGTLTVT